MDAKRVGSAVIFVAIGFLLTWGLVGMLGGGIVGLMAAWLLYRALRRGAFRPALRWVAKAHDSR